MELLIVISIILVLISLLMPALAKCRNTANSTLCSSNLHQFGLAFSSYLGDFNEYYPGALWQNNLNAYINPNGKAGWTSTGGYSLKVGHCPGANPSAKITYAYTGVWWDTGASPGYFASVSYPYSCAKNTAVVLPSQKCLLNEKWPDVSASFWGGNYLNDQSCTVVHNIGSNFLMADSRVQFVRLLPPIPFSTVKWDFDPIYMYKKNTPTTRLN